MAGEDSDDTLELEAKFFERGLQEGIARGDLMTYPNGLRHGKEEGHQIGFEVGFMRGVAEACMAVFANDQAVVKAAVALMNRCERISLQSQPSREALQMLRARFKVLESRAGLTLSSSSQQDMSF